MRLRWRGEDILRAAPAEAVDVLQAGCFPLVPYCNRIALGRFRFGETEIHLETNFGEHPNPLHGVGWRNAWQLTSRDEASADLRLTHDGDEHWPFAFEAEQQFEVSPQGLRARVAITNHTAGPVPAGLGFHPYFARLPSTRLRFEASRVWQADETLLPTNPASVDHFADWRAGAIVDGAPFIDNAYEGWTGHVCLGQPGRTVHLTSDRPGWLHLLIPKAGDFLCVEPVSHGPNALVRGWPMAILAPGQSFALTMMIGAVRSIMVPPEDARPNAAIGHPASLRPLDSSSALISAFPASHGKLAYGIPGGRRRSSRSYGRLPD